MHEAADRVRDRAALRQCVVHDDQRAVVAEGGAGELERASSVRGVELVQHEGAEHAVETLAAGIRIFAPGELDAALDYLGAAGSERAELARVLEELKGKLGLIRQSSHPSQ